MKIAIACGGTGGHILPGLATALALRRRGHEVVLWLAGRSVERDAIAGWPGAVELVRASAFSGVSVGSVRALGQFAVSTGDCFRRFRRAPPDVLLAMGSYSSVAPVLGARLAGCPVVLHEANVIPGRAIVFLKRFAEAVGIAFEEAAVRIAHRRVVLTGLPLREALARARRFPAGAPERDARLGELGLKPGGFTVLVMGGSQGARVFNERLPALFAAGVVEGGPVQVLHLAGRSEEAAVRARYAAAGVPAAVHGYLSDMAAAYGVADAFIGRSGAATCAEVTTCGVPALLIPLPSARGGHQLANANAIRSAGGATVLEECRLSEAALAEFLRACREHSPSALAAAGDARGGKKGVDHRRAADALSDLVERVGRRAG